ncbi:hypothetical protein M8494_26820 [Serratia ureilytica]
MSKDGDGVAGWIRICSANVRYRGVGPGENFFVIKPRNLGCGLFYFSARFIP